MVKRLKVEKSMKNVFPCDHCSYLATRKYNLGVHMDIMHPEGRSLRLICLYCGLKFPLKRNLINHIKKSHQGRNIANGTGTLKDIQDTMGTNKLMAHDLIKDVTVGVWNWRLPSNRFTSGFELNHGQRVIVSSLLQQWQNQQSQHPVDQILDLFPEHLIACFDKEGKQGKTHV